MPSFGLEAAPAQEVKHGLGTQAVIVQGWQNGYNVALSARIVDEHTVAIYNLQDDTEVVIIAGTPPPVRQSRTPKKRTA